jgi:OOP family OmpA-OmpF porin
METGLVTASAADLAAGIVRDGHINVYAIYFDTGKAALKPESGPALAEVGRLMKSKPALKLHVVRHRDNTGQLAMNMKLSGDRAASVMKAVTADHGVGAERLDAHGVRPLAPVALTPPKKAGRKTGA